MTSCRGDSQITAGPFFIFLLVAFTRIQPVKWMPLFCVSASIKLNLFFVCRFATILHTTY